MTVFDFPALNVTAASVEWWKSSNNLTFTSPLDNTMQVVELPGDRWMCSFPFASLEEVDAARLESLIYKLRGQANRVRLPYFKRPQPRGTVAGALQVNGNQASGAALNIKGATVGTTLLEGDMIGVGGQLRMVVADATANGSGQMSLALDAPLRADVLNNDAIVWDRPTTQFILTTPESPHFSGSPGPRGRLTSTTLQFQEIY